MNKVLSFVFEVFKIVILALVIVLPIRYFVFQPFIVKGASMEPNFHHGDYLVIDELTYRFRPPKRGEVIVFRYPKNPSQRFIKRIIGLPEEKIKLTKTRIEITDKFGNKWALNESGYLKSYSLWNEEEEVRLGRDEYFVLGDNRLHSFDSRKWGVLPRDDIVGRVILRLWPLMVITYFVTPEY